MFDLFKSESDIRDILIDRLEQHYRNSDITNLDIIKKQPNSVKVTVKGYNDKGNEVKRSRYTITISETEEEDGQSYPHKVKVKGYINKTAYDGSNRVNETFTYEGKEREFEPILTLLRDNYEL